MTERTAYQWLSGALVTVLIVAASAARLFTGPTVASTLDQVARQQICELAHQPEVGGQFVGPDRLVVVHRDPVTVEAHCCALRQIAEDRLHRPRVEHVVEPARIWTPGPQGPVERRQLEV